MLANIKAYQSETAVSALLHKTLLRVVTGRSFTKGSLSVLTSSCCLFKFTQNALVLLTGWFGGPSNPTKWIKNKEVSWVWLVLSAH